MKFISWTWLLPIFSASAVPLELRATLSGPPLEVRSDGRTIITDPDTGRTFVPGETSQARTVYALVSLICAVLLALLLGLRAKTLKNNVVRKANFTSYLVVFLFILALTFIFCTSIVESGQSLRTHQLCYSAAIICLVFYTSNKLTIYIFLLERARIVRAPFMPRHKDWLWISGMIIICGGFGTIAVIGYLSPIVELSKIDGKCRIGLPPKVSFPLMCFDVGVNFLLTGVFIWLLKPVLSHHGLLSVSGLFGTKMAKNLRRAKSEKGPQYTDSQLKALNKNIRILLWKCLIGSTMVMLPTIGNMTQFYVMKGRELGWICLTICTLDVSWGVIIVNWLTVGSAKAEKNLTTLISQQTIVSVDVDGPVPPILRSRANSLATPPPPAVLQDAGKLLGFDNEVSAVPENNKGDEF